MSVAVDELEPENNKGFFGHPWGLSTLFLTEMWERFSFYGIRPLLTLFMAAAMLDGGFGFERTQATAIVGIYSSSVYLASLPGGWIADRLLGLRRAILLGAILISLGHISIGLSGFSAGKTPFFLGLILIVLGTGLLKAEYFGDCRRFIPGRRRTARCGIFDFLYGHQHRRVFRSADYGFARRKIRLASRFRSRRSRNADRFDGLYFAL